MCGRFVSPDEAAFEREWSWVPSPHNYFQSFNVAPSTKQPVILAPGGEPTLLKLSWGFQKAGQDRKHINARQETVFEKWSFRRAARETRCIVPVAGWYEWDRSKNPKQPYYHTRTDGRSFGLAGIFTETERNGIAVVYTFGLLTRAANEWAAPIHHRMPVLLHPRDYEAWLAPDTPLDAVQTMTPFDDGLFDAYPVSTFVNRVANNSAQCIERLNGH